MKKTTQSNDIRELAVILMDLPEKARERISYMIEGALLVKEPEKEKGDPNVREYPPK